MLMTSSAPYIPAPPFLLLSSTLKFANVSALFPGLIVPGPPAAAVHHEVSLIAIVGGGVACILALAATAIIVVAMHGKAGLARFVRLCCALLCLSVLGALARPGRSLRLKSLALRGIFDRSRRQGSLKSKDQADDNVTNEGSSSRTAAGHYHASVLSAIFFSGRSSSTRAVSKRDSLPYQQPPSTTSVPVEDIVREQVQAHLQTSVYAYLVDLVELRIERAKEELTQLSVYQRRALETQGHAACQSDATDPVIEDLRSFNLQNGKANEANAISKEASPSGRVEDVWIQPLDIAFSIVEEAVRMDVGKASASSSAETQGAEILAEEGAMLYCKGQLGRRHLPNPDIEADVEPGRQEVVTQTMLLNNAGITSRGVHENQQSYTFTELMQVPEETSSDPASRKPRTGEGTTLAVSPNFPEQKNNEPEAPSGNNHSVGLVRTTGTGGSLIENVETIQMAMIPIPTKKVLPMHCKLRRSSKKGKSARNEVMLKVASSRKHNQAGSCIVTKDIKRMKRMILLPTKSIVPHWRSKRLGSCPKWKRKDAIPKSSKGNCKQPWNLGHMPLSNEMSSQSVGLSTSFLCAGSFGVVSLQSIDCTLTDNDCRNHLDHQDNGMLHHDMCTSGVFASSMDEPDISHHQVYVHPHHDYHNNLMHQQQYNPPSRCQSNSKSDAQFSLVNIAQMPTTNDGEFIRRPPKFSCTDDYGGPFDGVV